MTTYPDKYLSKMENHGIKEDASSKCHVGLLNYYLKLTDLRCAECKTQLEKGKEVSHKGDGRTLVGDVEIVA